MLSKLFGFLTKGGNGQVRARPIAENFSVSGQLSPEQIAKLPDMGFKTVICMRPDNEGFNQPAFATMEQAARAAGVDAFYLPVIPGSISKEQARALKKLLAGRKGPVLAYCASGNRCASAYAMASRL